MNLIEKLIKVRKAVPYIKKDARNDFHRFDYTSSSTVLAAVRAEMDAQGVLLVPRVIKADVQDHATAKGGHEFFTALDMEFTWVNAEDPTDTLVCSWYGQGLDSGEKGVGKAMTYAEKFFILKAFNIPTDKHDPDAGGKPQHRTNDGGDDPRDFPSRGAGAPAKPSPSSSGGKKDFSDYDPKGDTRPATKPQLGRLFAKGKTIQATDEEMGRFLKAAVGVDSSKDLNREQIDKVFKLLEGFESAGIHARDVFSEWLSFNPVGE